MIGLEAVSLLISIFAVVLHSGKRPSSHQAEDARVWGEHADFLHKAVKQARARLAIAAAYDCVGSTPVVVHRDRRADAGGMHSPTRNFSDEGNDAVICLRGRRIQRHIMPEGNTIAGVLQIRFSVHQARLHGWAFTRACGGRGEGECVSGTGGGCRSRSQVSHREMNTTRGKRAACTMAQRRGATYAVGSAPARDRGDDVEGRRDGEDASSKEQQGARPKRFGGERGQVEAGAGVARE